MFLIFGFHSLRLLLFCLLTVSLAVSFNWAEKPVPRSLEAAIKKTLNQPLCIPETPPGPEQQWCRRRPDTQAWIQLPINFLLFECYRIYCSDGYNIKRPLSLKQFVHFSKLSYYKQPDTITRIKRQGNIKRGKYHATVGVMEDSW